MNRRRWILIYAGHVPVIINGWNMAEVAAYERRWCWRVWRGAA
jgi:hypothetical protein